VGAAVVAGWVAAEAAPLAAAVTETIVLLHSICGPGRKEGTWDTEEDPRRATLTAVIEVVAVVVMAAAAVLETITAAVAAEVVVAAVASAAVRGMVVRPVAIGRGERAEAEEAAVEISREEEGRGEKAEEEDKRS